MPASSFNLPGAVNDSITTRVNNKKSLSRVYGSQTTFRINNLIRSVKLDAELNLSFLERKDRLPDVTEIVQEYFKLEYYEKHLALRDSLLVEKKLEETELANRKLELEKEAREKET